MPHPATAPPAVRFPLGRRLRAWLALLLLAGGLAGADVHSATGLHGAESPFAEGLYFPEAAHPGAPLHAEAAQGETLPPCPACLAQANPAGAPQPVAGGASPGGVQPAPLPAARSALRSGDPSLRRGRAPPPFS